MQGAPNVVANTIKNSLLIIKCTIKRCWVRILRQILRTKLIVFVKQAFTCTVRNTAVARSNYSLVVVYCCLEHVDC